MRSITLVFIASIIIGTTHFFFIPRKHSIIAESDFVSYLTAATIIRQGEGARIYDINLQTSVQQGITKPHKKAGLLPFRNLPAVAFLFTPWTYLSLEEGYRLFALLNLSLLGLFTFLLTKVFKSITKLKFWYLLPFIFLPSIHTLLQGRIPIFMSLIVLGIYISIGSKRQFAAGIFSGLILLNPQYALITPFVYLFVKNKPRFLIGFLFSLVSILLVSVYLSGLDSLLSYPQFLLLTERASFGSPPSHVFGLTSALVSLPLFSSFSYRDILILNGGLYLVVLFLFFERYKLVRLSQTFASATLFSLVFSPHVLVHGLTILLVPIFIFLNEFFRLKGDKKVFVSLLALLLFLIPIVTWNISARIGTLISFVIAVALLSTKLKRNFKFNRPLIC